jgi:hypothetical protein
MTSAFGTWMLTSPFAGPLRCREPRRPLHQLRRLPDRMSHPNTKTEEGAEQRCAIPRLGQVLQPLPYPLSPAPDVPSQRLAAIGPTQKLRELSEGSADPSIVSEEKTTDPRIRPAQQRFQAELDLQPSTTPMRAPRRLPTWRLSNRKRKSSTMLPLRTTWISS